MSVPMPDYVREAYERVNDKLREFLEAYEDYVYATATQLKEERGITDPEILAKITTYMLSHDVMASWISLMRRVMYSVFERLNKENNEEVYIQ